MTLSIIGLGLWNENSMTLEALEEAKKCDKLYAEFYTAKLFGTTKEKLEEKIGKKIEELDRDKVENGAWMIEEAKTQKIGLLIVGDCMTATTHIELKLEAENAGIETKTIFGTSIYTAAAGLCGLQIYKFGRSTSITFPDERFQVRSHYDVIKKNQKDGLHTLCLLDIRDGKFMTANEGMKILLEAGSLKLETEEHASSIERQASSHEFTEETEVVVIARAGSEEPMVRFGKVKNLLNKDFGAPMHTIIVPGKLHFKEEEALKKNEQ
ncbi:MAG: diphthine synthase [archaeon]